MLVISASELTDMLGYNDLIDALSIAFQSDYTVPKRHHHDFENPKSNNDSTLLLMPAWQSGKYLGVKVVTVSPENRKYELPAIQGTYLLFDAVKGTLLAQVDGPTLTARRTAAASALASSFLAKKNSSSFLMVGTGVLAPQLIQAHASIHPIKEVYIWGRDFAKAEQLAAQVKSDTVTALPIQSIEDKASEVDIISCATLSKVPLLQGKWLRPGQHVDLVGSYLPDSREADDDVIKKAVLFADNRDSACQESGDLFIPIQRGIITKNDVKADLFELCRKEKTGRTHDDDITCFKSVGHALEDLAAAQLAFDRLLKKRTK